MLLSRWLFPVALAQLVVLGSNQDEASLEKHAVNDPDDVEMHRQLGHASQANGDLSGALLSFRRAAAISPANASDLLELGSVLGRLGELDEATAILQVAIQVQPDAAGIYMDLGIARAQQGRFEEAEASMRAASKSADSPGTVLNLARLLRMNGRHAEAADELQHAIENAEEPPPVHVLSSFAESLEASSRIDEAVDVREEAANRARHGTDEAFEARDALAAALYARDDLSEEIATSFFLAVAEDNSSVVSDMVGEFPTLLNFHDEWGMSALAVAALAGSSRSLQWLLDAGVEPPKKAVSIFPQEGEHISSVHSLLTLRTRHLLRRLRFQPSWILASPDLDDALKQQHTRTIDINGSVMADPTVVLLLQSGLSKATSSDLERASTFLLEPVVAAILENPQGLENLAHAASSALFTSLRSVLGWRQAYLPQALLKDANFSHSLKADLGLEFSNQDAIEKARRFGATEITDAIQPVLNGIVSRLLDAGANPDYVPADDSSGMRALHRCAESNLPSVAQSLLSARASRDSTNALGQTPLDVALSHRGDGVARLLSEQHVPGGTAHNHPDFETLGREQQEKMHAEPSCQSFEEEGVGKCKNKEERSNTSPSSDALCGVDQIEAASMNPQLFKEHILRRRPLLIRGAGQETWPDAMSSWSPEYLAQTVGDANLTASCIPYARSFGRTEDLRDVSLSSFVHKELARRETNSAGLPYYIFVPHPTMAKDPPEAWGNLWALIAKDLSLHPSSLFELGTPELKWTGGNTQFAVGPPGSGSSPHYHTHAYNIAVVGHKRWFLYPPGQQAMSQTHPMNLGDHPEPGPAPLMCDQAPGDIMYVPLDWGHAVLNLNDTISVAREFFDATQDAPFGSLLNIAARTR